MSDFEVSTREGHRIVLMSEALFEECIDAIEKRDGKKLTIEWGEKHVRSYLPYFEPTIYELDPQADPLDVQADDNPE